ncbi:MAG: ribonuclease D [Gammaproteobacteria bacterium]|nr:ribonuclease D [Gammaproteobacteria bacterium]
MEKISSPANPHVTFITREDQLSELVAHCLTLEFVALDTEFVRFNTFYPKFGLVQVSDGRQCYLIDPVAVTDLTPLKALLEAQHVVKILHSASEDLEVFSHHLGCLPVPLHDTQIAAAMVGQGYSISYRALVEQLTGTHLAKEETRSDWLQRPLTDAQVKYAALDVAYLPEVYQVQCQLLAAKGRQEWLTDECNRLMVSVSENWDPENYYLRVKSAWKLDRQSLHLLSQMCIWREGEARRRDIPRSRVLADKDLLSLARQTTDDLDSLEKVDLPPKQKKRYGDTLLALVKDARQDSESQWPTLLERPPSGEDRILLQKLRDWIDRQAVELDCSPEILAKKKQLEAVLHSRDASGEYHLPESFQGWRRAAIGDAMLAFLGTL